MATRMTQVNLARLSRRTGGLDRLAGQYKQQVAAMTDEYSQAFGDYSRRVSATMAPYEEAVRQYQTTTQPRYQQQVADYNAKLEAYRQQLADLEKDPVVEKTGEREYRTWYGKKKTEQFTYYEPKEIPTFTEKLPELPDAPMAPQIEQFDSSQFEGKRQMASAQLQREVGERRAARLQATRRTARTMLGGVKA
jgi:uncharacterized protein YjbJ (UPF0337 family)